MCAIPAGQSRTAAAVFFSGGVSTMSLNHAVQLPISEMVGDVSCADALFEAPSPAGFAQLLRGRLALRDRILALKKSGAVFPR
jgi:hypothetical protein